MIYFRFYLKKNVSTPMDDFNLEKFGDKDIWKLLRNNNKKADNFVRACYHKIDAFRVLQFLKWRSLYEKSSDEENLKNWFVSFYPDHIADFSFDLNNLVFDKSSIDELNQIRDKLVKLEEQYQQSGNIEKQGIKNKFNCRYRTNSNRQNQLCSKSCSIA